MSDRVAIIEGNIRFGLASPWSPKSLLGTDPESQEKASVCSMKMLHERTYCFDCETLHLKGAG